jgi:hypothetical protein
VFHFFSVAFDPGFTGEEVLHEAAFLIDLSGVLECREWQARLTIRGLPF